jgi:tRNA threonylcarbamoyl adenosine modification protein YeaZ
MELNSMELSHRPDSDPTARQLSLGIDTSTVVCVGLASAGQVLASTVVDDPHAHAEKLMPLLRQTLADTGFQLSEVTQIAVGVGPGPFTGLRVGVAAAATLGEVLGVPVLGVCSLDVLARQALPQLDAQEFIVASDARRKELYWAVYSPLGARLRGPFVTAGAELPALPTCGPAARLYPLPGSINDAATLLDAGILAATANELPPASLEPLYLRRPDAQPPQQRKSVLPKPRIAVAKLRRPR